MKFLARIHTKIHAKIHTECPANHFLPYNFPHDLWFKILHDYL